MPAKISTHVFKGMLKDVNVANSSNEYLFDAHNIRFNLLDDNTLMSITNERGNIEITFAGTPAPVIKGEYVSSYVIDNYIVVFTHVDAVITGNVETTPAIDRIYRISDIENINPTLTLMFLGFLKISPEHPLEFTSYYEAEDVIKIYWTDGINQLRFMNITSDTIYTNPNDFNTTPELLLNETVTVELVEGNGQFPAGVIQYAFTYVNKLGAESNIFYTTKLYSIQYLDRAGGPQEYINCAFKITLNNIDRNFDYIRCYQLIRTTLDGLPTGIILNEVSTNADTIVIYDVNRGAQYDPTSLLFLKSPIVPYTLDLKSNTLFLGNLNEDILYTNESIIQTVRDFFLLKKEYTNQDISDMETGQYAPPVGIPVDLLRFDNLSLTSYQEVENVYNADQIRTFKSRETYRIAVQFLNIFGYWSEPIYLKDIKADCRLLQKEDTVLPISLIFDIKKATNDPNDTKFLAFKQICEESNYKKFRFLMVNPTIKDRDILAQGMIVPTMYEVSDRCNNSPYSYNSWYIRPINSSRLTDYGSIEGLLIGHNCSVKYGKRTDAELQSCVLDNSALLLYVPYSGAGSGSTNCILRWKISFGWGTMGGSPALSVHFFCEVIHQYELINYQPIDNMFVLLHLWPFGPNTKIFEYDDNNPQTTASLFRKRIYESLETKLGSLSGLIRYLVDNYPEVKQDFHDKIYYDSQYITPTTGGKNIYSYDLLLTNVDLTNYSTENIDTSSRRKTASLSDFRVDYSVLNLYSPDLSDNWYNINNTKLNVNIVGYAPINGLIDNTHIEVLNIGSSELSGVVPGSSFNIKLHSDVRNVTFTKPIYQDSAVTKEKTGVEEDDDGTYTIYRRRVYLEDSSITQGIPLGQLALFDYYIYPWHKATSLNNEDNTDFENTSAKYTNKIFAKNWLSNITKYFVNPFKYLELEVSSKCSTDLIKVCNYSNNAIIFKQDGMLKLYMPNVDIARTFVNNSYDIYVKDDRLPSDISDTDYLRDSYPFRRLASLLSGMIDHTADGKKYKSNGMYISTKGDPIVTSKDSIQIKYTSDIHAVIPINRIWTDTTDQHDNVYSCGQLFVLPALNLTLELIISAVVNDGLDNVILRDTDYSTIWDLNAYKDSQQYLSTNNSPNDYFDNVYVDNNAATNDPFVYIGELLNLNSSNTKYGGEILIDEYNGYDLDNPILLNNLFIPIMESISLDMIINRDELSPSIVATSYGDTWFGSWDCLKTQHTTDLDLLSIHDYISIKIESHNNLNGRYDAYRNFYDLTLVNIQNANKFNTVYNLMDTFWLYTIVPNYLRTTNYPNHITWSLTKLAGALIDEWTRVVAANIEQLDGTKGDIQEILNYRDALFVFQDKCISQIKYNELTLMTTTEGVPVEISNSQKVTGVVKVYDGTGCINKWSIASDANGVFFIDNINKCIMWLGGSLDTPIVNLTNSKAFTLFMKANNSFDVWNPESFSNFVTFIDSAHKDVYFVNADKCLCFSLVLLEFTSFYDYQGTFGMFNINNNFYSLYDKNGLKLYRNFTGKYNEIYGELVDTSFTFIDHGESFLTDKTFTNINYILDAYDVSLNALDTIEDYDGVDYAYEKDVTFSTLRVWTPFLDTGDVTLTPNEDLQRKFRTWGILIQRDLKYNNTSVDRIRNNWAKFKFTFTQPDENKDIKIELMNINILSIE